MNQFVPLYGSGGGRHGSAFAGEYDVDRMNEEFAFVLVGSNERIYWDRPDLAELDGDRWLSMAAFKAKSLNAKTTIKRNGRSKTVTFAERWLEDTERRDYDGVEFFPNSDGAAGRPGFLNLWKGFAVAPSAEGSCEIFKDHLRANICNDDPDLYLWLFAWIAQIVQRPREKPGTAIVLRGGMGVGKSIVGDTIGSLFPRNYMSAESGRYVTGQFNSHQETCIVFMSDEAFWAGSKDAEARIKGLITSQFNTIEHKGLDPIRVANYLRLILTSNSSWVVPAGKDERRFAVFDVNPRCAENHAYFGEMVAELDAGGRARLLHELLSLDISSVNLRSIPRTAALLEQKIHSFDPIEAWWFGRLHAGEPTRKHGLWPEFVPTDALIDDYLAEADRVGIRHKGFPTQFGIKFKKLVPEAKKLQRSHTEEGQSYSRRVWGYVLPPLDAARAAFEEAVQQPVDWEGGS